ncbi:MAG TPA: hypothetical protein VH063_11525 [Gaiellaceae bacterium]|jgi:hypothetical protein|nr:hypothetical protein [Gaiellaceae bacterium]
MSGRETTRRTGLAACIALACLAAATSGRTAAAAAAAGCNVPITHDPYDGYHVGVPAGWQVFRTGGRLVVTPSATAPIQSIVAPVVLSSGVTPSSYFASALGTLDRQIDAIGNAMSYRVTSTRNGIPQATLTGRAGKTALTGRATVLVLPDRTAHGSQLAVLLAYWAPTASFASLSGKLAGVGLCYGAERAPLFRVFHDQAFTYAMPPGFEVTSEGQDELRISLGANASANYLLTLLPASDGVTSVQSLQQFVFASDRIKITKVLSSSLSGTERTSSGAIAQDESLEFLGILNGSTPVHGLASIDAATASGSDASGTIRLALTSPSTWNSTGGAVIRIASGVQHSFTQDLQQWERLSQQQQAFGSQVSGFDQALNGEDLVQDNATGQTFEAPYSSFLQSGPDGPGYYSGSAGALQKLQIVTPS